MVSNMKKLILAIAIAAPGALMAQQLPQYSQYLRNQYMVNPGSAGLYNFLDITMSGRWQWAGFTNAPMTAYIAGSSPINSKAAKYNPSLRVSSTDFRVNSAHPAKNPEITTGKLKHAVGGQMVVDQYGAFRKMHLSGTYAIHVPVFKGHNLAMGVKLGLANNAFLQNKVDLLNDNDPTYSAYTGAGTNKYFLDLGAGLYLYSSRLFIGISADQLTKDYVSFGSGQTLEFDQHFHYYLIGGYKFQINENFTITPATLIKMMAPAPISGEFTLQLEYKEFLWGGLGYRHGDSMLAMFGMNFSKNFKFGYSFDFTLSRIRAYSAGGHQLVLGLMIGRQS
jgi:type IX secretion system PorP/SprF family membrane protein